MGKHTYLCCLRCRLQSSHFVCCTHKDSHHLQRSWCEPGYSRAGSVAVQTDSPSLRLKLSRIHRVQKMKFSPQTATFIGLCLMIFMAWPLLGFPFLITYNLLTPYESLQLVLYITSPFAFIWVVHVPWETYIGIAVTLVT